MTDHAVVAATVVLGLSSVGSGWLMWRASARWAATFTAAAGVALVLGPTLAGLGAGSAASHVLLAAGTVLLPLAVVGYPGRPDHPVPWGCAAVVPVAGVVSQVAPELLDACSYVLLVTVGAAAWWHAEQGDAGARRAVAWMTTAWLTAGFVAGLVMFLADGAETTSSWVFAVALLLCSAGPLAMAVGVVRPEVVDVRGVVTEVVVVTTTFVSFLACAVGGLSLVEVLGGRSPGTTGTVVWCGVLAFGVRPTALLLRGVVDRLLFGDRPLPLAAATQVADRIGADPVVALRAVREALVLPYASLRVAGTELVSSGEPVAYTRALPLRLGKDAVGEVVVGLRPGDLTLARGDADVLRIVAPLLAQTLRLQALTDDLRDSRGAAISAIEEERRRLRRDLHDGLGPTLTGVAYAADAARNHLVGVAGEPGPAAASTLLDRLRRDVGDAVEEVRRLVEGLRPPVLDQLGLVAAVRQHAGALHTAAGEPIAVEVLAYDVPALPAAAEVASYRIVVEALTNVARHATATAARVELGVEDGALRLVVEDDGAAQRAWSPGVGLSSMRERAEQLGGRLDAAPGPSGGRVCALIPL